MSEGDATRIDAVWGETLTLPQPVDASLRLASVPDGTHVPDGSAATLAPPTVRRVRSEHAAGPPRGEADYRLGDAIGRGGMGVVHSAWQESVGRRVALKLVRDDLRGDPLAESRFRSEAALTGTLEHPGIVPVYDLGADEDGRAFFAMKLVSGKPWSGALRAMTVADNLAVLLRVAEAVAFAHHHGVVHADLKPANVMLGDYGEVLLLDWGLALRLEDGRARPLAPGAPVGGTPAYMAPEQAMQDLPAIGPATDVYLLGAILYEIAGGVRPHAGTSLRSCLTAAARNELAPAEGDPELLAIARRALATSPADRHPDVAAFVAALRAWRTHADSTGLLVRARELAGGSLAAGADALRAIAEARALWPDNPHADATEAEVRRAWAGRALAAGDAALALAAARPDREPELHTQALALAQRQQRELRRLRWLRAGTIVLGLAVLAGAWLAHRLVTDAERQAVAAQARAEDARRTSEAEAYRARLAQALAAAGAGDRDGALALLDACPAGLRGCEWDAIRTRAEESVRQLPGFPDGAHCVAWADAGRRLWIGGAGFVRLIELPTVRVVLQAVLPSTAQYLSPGPRGLLVGMHRGCAYLAADGTLTMPAAFAEPVTRVAQSAGGACLLVSRGAAWRWTPGGEPEQAWPAAVAVDWHGERPVVATADEVLLDGQRQMSVTDGDIQAVHWRPEVQVALLRRGPRIRNDGSLDPLPANSPPTVPREPAYELRRRDGAVLRRADQFYLDRDPAITADGTGFAIVHARYHTVVSHAADMPAHRAVFPEPVAKCALAGDGTLAVAWAGGVGLMAPTRIRHTLIEAHHDVPLAMAFAGDVLGVVNCSGSFSLLRPEEPPIVLAGGRHQLHEGAQHRIALLPAGGFLAPLDGQPHRIAEDGKAAPVGAAEGRPPHRAIASPNGRRLLWYDDDGLRLHADGPGPVVARSLPVGWIDDERVLVVEGRDLVARHAAGWGVAWRAAGAVQVAQRVRALRLGPHLLTTREELVDIRAPDDGRVVRTLDRHRGHVTALATDGQRLITGDSTGYLAFWSLPGYQLVQAFPWSGMAITAIAGAPGRLAVGSEERMAHVWRGR